MISLSSLFDCYFFFSKTKVSKLTWAFMLAPSKYTWPPCSCTRLQTSLKGNCQWNSIPLKPSIKYKFVKVNEKDITMMTRHSALLPLLFLINPSLRPGSGRKELSFTGVFRTLSNIYDNYLYEISKQNVLPSDRVLNKPLRFANNESSLPEVLCKTDTLKNFRNSQENTCTRVSF